MKKESSIRSISAGVPHDFQNITKTIHTLPSGSETGTLLHSILEKIKWNDPEQWMATISQNIRGTLFSTWDSVFYEIITNAAKVPLSAFYASFHLSDINPSQNYREMEFLFPSNTFEFEKFPELSQYRHYLKGVVDYIFEHEGMYYIIDWKSNWLGPNVNNYDQKAMEAAIQEHRYDLQAAIYTQALKKYLAVVEHRPFEECFGGTFYMFLRGISSGNETGIYYFYPEKVAAKG